MKFFFLNIILITFSRKSLASCNKRYQSSLWQIIDIYRKIYDYRMICCAWHHVYLVKNLKVMARMGVYIEEEVQRRYPEFPTRRGEWSWEDYLPPMGAELRGLMEAYG